MIYSLDTVVVCNNQTILDAIKNKVPAKLDNQIWADEYTVSQGTSENGDSQVSIMVRFKEDVKRQAILTWIKNKAQAVQAEILEGSYIGYHLCDHDLGNGKIGCTPRTILWSK